MAEEIPTPAGKNTELQANSLTSIVPNYAFPIAITMTSRATSTRARSGADLLLGRADGVAVNISYTAIAPAQVYSNSQRPLIVPLWPIRHACSSVGATISTTGHAQKGLKWVYISDGTDSEIGRVSSVSSSSITLTAPLSKSYPAGSTCIPAIRAILSGSKSMRLSPQNLRPEVSFTEL